MNFGTSSRSEATPDVTSAARAEAARGVERATTHAAISVLSPGKEDEDEKNQDRLMVLDTTDGGGTRCRFAVVCDGTSTSPHSAAAAQYVSGQVRELFEEGGIRRAAAVLEEMRLALLDRPLKLDEGQSEMLRGMFEEIVRRKYRNAYQTTFVAVLLQREEAGGAGALSVKALACGDSALFVFREDGELLYNNVNLAGSLDPFKHGSPFTAVLPDSYAAEAEHLLFDFTDYPEDVHLLLCSDGLYDAFANFKEIYDWLNEHRAELKSAALREQCLTELHDRLRRTKGDDDISFIWLCPPAVTPTAEAGEEVKAEEDEEAPHEESGEDDARGFFTTLLAGLLRWLGLKDPQLSRPRRRV